MRAAAGEGSFADLGEARWLTEHLTKEKKEGRGSDPGEDKSITLQPES